MQFWLIIFCGFLSFSLSAQWNITQSQKIGELGDEDMNDLIALDNGNYLCAGFTSSATGIVTNNFGQTDFWLIEFNANHEIVWNKTYGSPGSEEAFAIAKGTNSFYIVGTTDTAFTDISGLPTQINNFYGGIDIWLIEIDQQGNLLQETTLGGSDDDQAKDILRLENGNLLILGESKSNDFNLTENKGSLDVWLVELDDDFNIIRQKNFGGTKSDGGAAMQLNDNGNLILACYATSDDGDVTSNIGSRDVWLIELDEDWNITWQSNWGGTNAEGPNDFIILNNGDLAICAETGSSQLNNFHGLFDFSIAVFDNTGNLKWDNCYGGSNADSPFQIIENSFGNLMVIGYTFSTNGDVNLFYAASDVWLMEANANDGTLLNRHTLGGNKFEEGSSIIETANGQYLIISNTDSTDGDLGKNPKDGNHDLWIATLQDESIAIENPNESPSIRYNFEHKTLQLLSQNPTEVQVFNAHGQLILSQKINVGNSQLNLAHLNKGIYFAKLAQQTKGTSIIVH